MQQVKENRPKRQPVAEVEENPVVRKPKRTRKETGPEEAVPSRNWNPLARVQPEQAQRLRRVCGLFVIAFAALLLVALVSHLFTGQADASFAEYGPTPSRDVGHTADNAAGSIGAFFAQLLITQGYGFIALLVPPYLGLVGYVWMQQRHGLLARHLGIYLFFVLHWVAFFMGFVTVLLGLRSPDWGGGVGLSLTVWTSYYIGLTGSALTLAFLLGGFLILRFNAKADFIGLLASMAEQLPKAQTDTATATAAANPQDHAQTAVAKETTIDEEDENFEGDFNVSIRKADPVHTDTIPFVGTADTEPDAQQMQQPASVADDGIDLIIEQPQPSTDLVDNIVQVDEERFEKLVPEADQEVLEDDEDVGDWEAYDPFKELASYNYPTLELLRTYESPNGHEVNRAELEANKNKIIQTLRDYSIEITSIKATIGPAVTLYEIVPAAGVRINKIKGLEDDIALSLSAKGIRIIAPMPGKGTIGIEIPISNPDTVSFRSLVGTEKFRDTKYELPIAIGKTVSNEVFIADLAKMPHLLVAGATGQGKSVGLNCIIASILYKKHPSQVKFVLIDPKKVEMALYQVLEKHFLAKMPGHDDAIITDNKDALGVLSSLTIEMDNRYQLLKEARVRNVQEYNVKFMARKLSPRKGHRYMPYLVTIVDELADLMMTSGKEVESPIIRLAQLGRAAGLHMVIATQRPSVNVITGIIKANFPARLSYRVISKVDSRTILDANGAEQLVGRGDALLSTGADILRIQNAFVDTPEIEQLVTFIGKQIGYSEPYVLPEVVDQNSDPDEDLDLDTGELDTLYDEAARLVVRAQLGSTSLIQRKMSIGYNRAGRIMDQLERTGVVGAAHGSKPREVLIQDEVALERFLLDRR